MTNVAVTLSRRTLAVPTSLDASATAERAASAPSTSAAAQPTSLAKVRPGGSAVVTGYAADGPPATLRRLVDLGFGIGERVEAVRRAPLGDPVVYRIAGYEVALRRTESRLVTVRGA